MESDIKLSRKGKRARPTKYWYYASVIYA